MNTAAGSWSNRTERLFGSLRRFTDVMWSDSMTPYVSAPMHAVLSGSSHNGELLLKKPRLPCYLHRLGNQRG